MLMMIIPTVTAVIGALSTFFVLGGPITFVTKALENFITGLGSVVQGSYDSSSVPLAALITYGAFPRFQTHLRRPYSGNYRTRGYQGPCCNGSSIWRFSAAVIAHFIKKPPSEETEGIKIAF